MLHGQEKDPNIYEPVHIGNAQTLPMWTGSKFGSERLPWVTILTHRYLHNFSAAENF